MACTSVAPSWSATTAAAGGADAVLAAVPEQAASVRTARTTAHSLPMHPVVGRIRPARNPEGTDGPLLLRHHGAEGLRRGTPAPPRPVEAGGRRGPGLVPRRHLPQAGQAHPARHALAPRPHTR